MRALRWAWTWFWEGVLRRAERQLGPPVSAGERTQPVRAAGRLSTVEETPVEPGDGTRWLHFPAFGEWHGWQPGEDGLWIYSEAEFANMYPGAQ